MLQLPLSCLLNTEEWKGAASLATDCAHAGWNTAWVRCRESCGRICFADSLATDRGAERATFRRESILNNAMVRERRRARRTERRTMVMDGMVYGLSFFHAARVRSIILLSRAERHSFVNIILHLPHGPLQLNRLYDTAPSARNILN